MQASILLKFGTLIGGTKANACIDIGVNLLIIRGVLNNFMHKTKSNFCQAYKVNRFEEQAENRYVARLYIRGVPFGS